LQAGTHPLLHLALLAAARAATGAATVVTAHDLQPKNSGRFGAWCAAQLHRAADRVVVHSEALRAALAARQPEVAARTRVVPHGESSFLADGARTDAPAAADGATPTLLFFGCLHEEKGLADLIEALPEIAARVPALRLVVAGQPEMAIAPLQARAAALRVAERIEWQLGYVAHEAIAPLFLRASGVVLPYRAATSQSGVLFLAGAYGKPLIATRVGALPESIAHGESGWLVPPREPAELARAAIALLSDPARAQEMGKKHALRCRTEGAWTAIAERTLALYAEVAPGFHAPRPPGKAGGEAPSESVVDARTTVACR
jgi:glycosyltransferase involved in cell wall biosynthesis